jgi:NAD(P)-dependent dehydrogenase (short-subunit alcohol dehydrogenase family)
VVTGASSGIGRATALALSGRGWHVFATVRRSLDGDALERATGGSLTSLLMDVTRLDEVARAAEAVRAHLGTAVSMPW